MCNKNSKLLHRRFLSAKDKADAKLTPLTNGHSSHPLKRTISHDSLAADSQSDSVELDASGRRSKRLRKGLYTFLISF